jgi:branched-chain amino acid transport system substrate-binding protein
VPLLTYRVGAYASSGIPIWAGLIDYLTYINEAEGGINGVKLFWDECDRCLESRADTQAFRDRS